MTETFVFFSQKKSVRAAICSFDALAIRLSSFANQHVTSMTYNPELRKVALTMEESLSSAVSNPTEHKIESNDSTIAIPLSFPCKAGKIGEVAKQASHQLFTHLLQDPFSVMEDFSISESQLSMSIKRNEDADVVAVKDDFKEEAISGNDGQENHLLLVDGNNLLNKVHFVTSYGKEPEEMEKDEDGNYIAAVKLFIKQIGLMLKKHSPNLMAVCWDTSKGSSLTFRAKLFPEYKGTREEKKHSDVFLQQFHTTREVLKQMGIPQFADESGEFEADDLIGTLQRLTKETAGYSNCTIISSDKDLYQLLDEHTVQVFKKGKEQISYSLENFREEYMGLEPLQMPHIKGIVGDKSDNIKGVPGCGDKTIPLLKEFKTIEGILENLHALPEFEEGKYKRYIKKFEEGREDALLSLKLATIVTDVPFLQSMNIAEELQFNINSEGAKKLFTG